jgi:hypothetical protein
VAALSYYLMKSFQWGERILQLKRSLVQMQPGFYHLRSESWKSDELVGPCAEDLRSRRRSQGGSGREGKELDDLVPELVPP